jgi:hypothetical protein
MARRRKTGQTASSKAEPAGSLASRRVAKQPRRLLLDEWPSTNSSAAWLGYSAAAARAHARASAASAHTRRRPLCCAARKRAAADGAARPSLLKQAVQADPEVSRPGRPRDPLTARTSLLQDCGGMIVRMPSRLQRVALVTGSSRGLSSAIAWGLAQDGLAVHVVTTARATRPGLNPTPRET